MLDYFNKYEVGKYRTLLQHPRWRAVELNAKINLEKVVKYCRSVESHGPTYTNALVRLIDHLSDGLTDDEFIYYTKLLDRAEGISSRVGLVTSNNDGTVYKNLLYSNSNEVVVYVNKYLNLEHFKHHWKIYSPLRLIYSQDSNMDFEAREKFKDIHGGTVFYELDVVKMMMLYRRWALMRSEYGRSVHGAIFLTQMLFPNMLMESININLFNRFIKMVRYGKHYKDTRKDRIYPFYLVNDEDKINKELLEYYNDFENRGVLYGRLINSLPVFDVTGMKPKEMLFYLRTNIPRNNIKMSWVLWCARLPYMRYLLEFLGENGFKYNRDLYTSFQREFLQFKTRGYRVNNDLPEQFKDELKDHIEYVRSVVFPNLK